MSGPTRTTARLVRGRQGRDRRRWRLSNTRPCIIRQATPDPVHLLRLEGVPAAGIDDGAPGAKLCFPCPMRSSRTLPRSFHGWKNGALGIPRQAVSSCQDHASLIGCSACRPTIAALLAQAVPRVRQLSPGGGLEILNRFGLSSFAITGRSAAPTSSITARARSTSAAERTNDSAIRSTPSDRANFRSSMSLPDSAGTETLMPGSEMPLLLERGPPSVTEHTTSSPSTSVTTNPTCRRRSAAGPRAGRPGPDPGRWWTPGPSCRPRPTR